MAAKKRKERKEKTPCPVFGLSVIFAAETKKGDMKVQSPKSRVQCLVVALPLLLVAAGCAVICTRGGDATPVWRQDDFTTTMHTLGGDDNVTVKVEDGLLHVIDAGTRSGEMAVVDKYWGADPGTGASVEARVRVVACRGLAGVMLAFSDGVHEEIITLYPDRIELDHARRSHAMDTTGGFHVYRVDIRETDVSVSVDGARVIHALGAFTRPAHDGRNRVSFGAGSSASTGEAWWDWVRWTEFPAVLRTNGFAVAGAVHAEVYKDPARYACFPGLAASPAGDALYTSFGVKGRATHFDTADTRTTRMESRDGGATWREIAAFPADAVPDMPNGTVKAADGALIRIGQHWRRWYPMDRLGSFTGRYDIVTSSSRAGREPNTFSVCSGGYVERSEDGGKKWTRTELPALDTYMSGSSPWSNAQLPDGTALRAFWVRRGKPDGGEVVVVRTKDGKTAEIATAIKDPANKRVFTEETLLHVTSKGDVWLLTRVHGAGAPMWQAVSRDGGRTWTARATDIDARQSPPSGLVTLDDGRLVMVYGYRDAPSGIRAVVSEDEGLTWRTDHVLVLRSDGDGFDLGYPRAVKLPGGDVLAVYYYATEDQVRHIACTRFTVPAFK
jgi:hypothetical protein